MTDDLRAKIAELRRLLDVARSDARIMATVNADRYAANLAPLLAAEVERLELELHKLHGECGHLQADAAEMADRLRAALEGST